MVSPQIGDHLRAFAEEKNLSMELLSDPGNRVADKYGLVCTVPEDLKKVYLKFDIDLEKYNGDDSWTLPLTARYIVDRDMIIRYAAVSADYTARPDPSQTIEALRRIL